MLVIAKRFRQNQPMAPRSYVLASAAQWQQLAKAVRVRRTELGLTQAAAVQRSGGLISAAVWSILEGARQRNGRMDERSLAGAERSLDWPAGRAAEILHGDTEEPVSDEVEGDEVLGIAAKAGRLSPEQRGRLTGYLDALLDELDETQ